MPTETRDFHLGDILSITTGRLVSPHHMDGVYDILNFMTGESLFTHQLPRASDECTPRLLEQHPDLAAVQVPENFGGSQETVDAWIAEQATRFGETRPVASLDPADHTRIDALTEIRKVAPQTQVIPVVHPGDSRG